MKKHQKHTRFCALEETCVVSGYGILLKNGSYNLFENRGNKKAEDLLRKMTKKNNLLIEAAEKINILSIKEIN